MKGLLRSTGKRLGLCVIVCALGVSTAVAQVVNTESGPVKGFDHEGTVGFLGIPYAKVERFMPPQPVEKWTAVRVCDHWGPQAMQQTGGRQLSEEQMSEQCCVLNVWTNNLGNEKRETRNEVS